MLRGLFGFLAVLCLATAFTAGAGAMTVEASKIIEGNYFVARDVVEIRGILKRDALIVARRVDIVGNIGGDAFIIASDVHVTGSIDGSARILARRVDISGVVGKNVMVVARSLTVGKGARIGWDVLARVATLETQGTVDGNVVLNARRVTIDGSVRKGIEARVSRSGTFVIGEHAAIVGDVVFFSPSEGLEVNAKAQIQGRINHDPSPGPIRARVTFGLVFLLGLAVVGAALAAVRPSFVSASAAILIVDPAHALLTALLTLLGALLVFPLLFFTVVGAPLTLLLIALTLACIYIGHLITSFVIGKKLLEVFDRVEHPFIILCAGLVPYAIIAMIPGLGSMLVIFGALFGFGAIVLLLKSKISNQDAK